MDGVEIDVDLRLVSSAQAQVASAKGEMGSGARGMGGLVLPRAVAVATAGSGVAATVVSPVVNVAVPPDVSPATTAVGAQSALAVVKVAGGSNE